MYESLKISFFIPKVFSYSIQNRAIGLMDSVFVYGPGDQGSIPGRVIEKT